MVKNTDQKGTAYSPLYCVGIVLNTHASTAHINIIIPISFILFILNYYLALWDLKIGILFALSLIALIFDLFIFTKWYIKDFWICIINEWQIIAM